MSPGGLGGTKEASIGEVRRGFEQLFNHGIEDGKANGRIATLSVLQRTIGFDNQSGD
jgi:hypothetical protein